MDQGFLIGSVLKIYGCTCGLIFCCISTGYTIYGNMTPQISFRQINSYTTVSTAFARIAYGYTSKPSGHRTITNKLLCIYRRHEGRISLALRGQPAECSIARVCYNIIIEVFTIVENRCLRVVALSCTPNRHSPFRHSKPVAKAC